VNMSKVVVAIMLTARIALALLVVTSAACRGEVEVGGDVEVCPAEPDAGACVCPVPPEPACVTCAELAVNGGDARALCDGETDRFYEVWECVVDAPQCSVCPAWPAYTVFAPTPLDESCMQCLVFEGCGAELAACGVQVSL